MTETLLSTSTVLIFGRVVEDLSFIFPETEVEAATTVDMPTLEGLDAGDGNILKEGDFVLVLAQADNKANGIYKVGPATNTARGTTYPWNREPLQPERGSIVKVKEGELRGSWKRKRAGNRERFKFKYIKRNKLGKNNFLENQLEGMVIARIYGFTYEGTYYDLPKAILFGVHGDGELVTQLAAASPYYSRAPREPSIAGVAAADFEFADDIRVWSYDKADYTIRMDVETGMFEQVLLDAYFADGGNVSGMKVGGPRVSGMKVSGMKVSGMKVGARYGGRGDGAD